VTSAPEPGPLDPLDPLDLLARWLPPNSEPLRPLMTLSTVDGTGYPDARSVLLSEVDDQGLYFHTDAGSRKVTQLWETPRACLTLVLPESARQLVVQGDVEPAPADELARAYAARSRYLQVLAWTNTSEAASLPPGERRDRWQRFEVEHPAGSLRPPPTWAGFLVRPARITFWQGDSAGPSTRTEYRRTASGWERHVLPG
jgi:pyridoxamine 5'-phosphate oxidase